MVVAYRIALGLIWVMNWVGVGMGLGTKGFETWVDNSILMIFRSYCNITV